MELNAEQLSNSYYAYVAWERAVNEGYVYKSIEKFVGKELYNLMVGGLVGIVASVGLVMVGSAVGSGVGAALGGYFSAGNPAAAVATAELGATIGKTVAEVALAAIGVLMVVDYIGEHMWEIGRYTIAAYDLAVNQAPYLAGQLYDTVIDLAARWFAEAVGMFCGFLVFAIATLMLVRFAKSKSATEIRDLFESKLNQMCKGIVQYIMPRAAELKYKLQPAGKGRFVVVSGGVGPGRMSIVAQTAKFARRIMPRVVEAGTRMVTFRRFADLDAYLRSEGFRLTGVKGWGPEGKGGQQLFYERGNVCCRVKTLGDGTGPRKGKAHVSFGMNDGTGTEWYNDMAKFSVDGKLAFKNNVPAERFKPITGGSNPKDFQGIQGGLDTRNGNLMQDEWAARTHFNLKDGFDWGGLGEALRGVPVLK